MYQNYPGQSNDSQANTHTSVNALNAGPEHQLNGIPDHIKIVLKRPIQSHGDVISEVNLKEPSGGDISTAGHPIKIIHEEGGGVSMQILSAPMTRLISISAGIPESSVKAMKFSDWNKCASAITGFLEE